MVAATTEGQANIIICPSKLLYHIPCPGCGITRATLLFFSGHIVEAIKLNPNVLFSIAFILSYPPLIINDLSKKHKLLQASYKYLNLLLHKRLTLTLFLSFELCVWILNAIRGI